MHYKFRNGAGDGIWCSVLLPLCLLPVAILSDSGICKLVFYLCTILPLVYFVKELTLKENNFNSSVFHSLLSFPLAFFLSQFTAINFVAAYFLCSVVIIYYSSLISTILVKCPGSFTIGEAQIITQTVTLFIIFCAVSLLNKAGLIFISTEKQILESTKFLQVLLGGCIFLVHCLQKVPDLKFNIITSILIISYALLMLTVWTICLGQNPVIWLLTFCLQNIVRISLILFWLACTSAAIIFVINFNVNPQKKNLTIFRKYFHFAIDAVFISGLVYDAELLSLASGVALAVFILLEICRLIDVPIIGSGVGDGFKVFLDEKDSGTLILTHIYLLIGCSLPVWMYSFSQPQKGIHICQLSGIISVGFGDTAAAYCGSSFGKHNWKDSKKTIEGTVAAVLIQLGCVLFFLYFCHELSICNFLLGMMAAILTSLLEAKTTQIDNLVLPLFMFSLLRWIH